VLELHSPILLRRHRNYTLHLSYTGLINRPHEGGLFASAYQAGEERRLIAATQMQPLDARRLLPCWDEPAWKARFRVVVLHPNGTRAISNTPQVGEEVAAQDAGGWRRSEFGETPRMAAYLLAVAITDFPYRETWVLRNETTTPTLHHRHSSIHIRLWSSPSTIEHTSHALEVAAKSLHFFEHYFHYPYPLEKLDIVGVPSLRVAAMENWGLVFCRQQNLLYTADVQTKRDRQFVTDILAHEIAHMVGGRDDARSFKYCFKK